LLPLEFVTNGFHHICICMVDSIFFYHCVLLDICYHIFCSYYVIASSFLFDFGIVLFQIWCAHCFVLFVFVRTEETKQDNGQKQVKTIIINTF